MQQKLDFENESVLVSALRAGDEEAFSWFVKKYRLPLMKLGLKMTAQFSVCEDALQDTFIKVYQKIETFEGRSSLKSWVYRIFFNTLRNHLRQKESVSLESFIVSAGSSLRPEGPLLHKQLAAIIEEVIRHLPERQKLAVTLRLYEDLSFDEIATIMECPYDTAKANWRHGLLKIQEELRRRGICATDAADHQESQAELLPLLVTD